MNVGMAMPAPFRPYVVGPEPQLRLARASVAAESLAAPIPAKVVWIVAGVAIGFVLALILLAQRGQQPMPGTDPEQAWFWTPGWLMGEAEANADIAAGRTTFYGSDEDFLASLEEPTQNTTS
jgi:hypothetical protein